MTTSTTFVQQIKEFHGTGSEFKRPISRTKWTVPDGERELRELARRIRLHAVRMTHRAKSSHVGEQPVDGRVARCALPEDPAQ